ncbi:hypothetical protein H310_14948 [Aphanomyces invadans]|uniref:Tetraspanin n=1 Tax=Aphanomyces invadans TaxID=157072 RepID=A0A024T836_9STRA|nr:hypothetical protein H310_14948 [Aphanomyces invadans]ETV90225.1 hypothetical protein H310_14948 [Aphanomyces invadans]|eukprot:XP_008881151.1 hypothetical protein H310_14948 [Aphanomyces invadans]
MHMHAVAKVVLILTNFAFIGGGGLLIWLGIKTRDIHWSEIFYSGAPADISTSATDLIALGATVIVIALFGLFGAVCQNRCVLTLYSIFVVLGLVVFVAVAVLGFMSASKAHSWTSKRYPAERAEQRVAERFNQAYCYAEGGRFCITTSVSDAIETFFPSVGGGAAAPFKAVGIDVDAKTGLLGLCDQVDAKLESVPSLAKVVPKPFKKACAMCKQVNATVGDFRGLFDWIDAKCPLTRATAQWCGKFVLTQDNPTSGPEEGSPYTQCRKAALVSWKGFGTQVGFGGVVLATLSLFLIGLSCNAARQDDGYTTII